VVRSCRLHQDHAFGLDYLSLADRPQLLSSLGFDRDRAGWNLQHGFDPLTDCLSMRADFRLLGMHNTIGVDEPVSLLADLLVAGKEQFGRIPIAIFVVGIWKPVSDIAQRDSAEQGITQCMKQYIGIAVPIKLLIVWNIDATYPQWPAGDEPVSVMPDPYSHRRLVGG
jgi:hypothetical protein